jgi:xanthine dehydrogenase YagR molybdenum-binding subunit
MIDPAAPTPVGNMGQPIPRYDARAKVTGAAIYAANVALPDVAYAYLLSSHIAKGRLKAFDLKAARALPGVLDILTSQTIGGDVREVKYATKGGPASNSVLPLGSAEIAYAGQPIAVVLAEPLEVAQDAASQIGIEYEEQPSAGSFESKGRLNRLTLSKTRNTTIPRSGISRPLMKPLRSKLTPAIQRRPSITIRSNCSPRNASGMARS